MKDGIETKVRTSANLSSIERTGRASLTIFFDGHCPLCTKEMQELNHLDRLNRLQLVDLHDEDFCELYPHVDKGRASEILQAQQADGTMLYGLDANCRAWELVDRKRWMQLLRWPVIRLFADFGYLIFARYRSTFAYLFTGKRSCERCALQKLGR